VLGTGRARLQLGLKTNKIKPTTERVLFKLYTNITPDAANRPDGRLVVFRKKSDNNSNNNNTGPL